jgi:hypothetical protein
MRHEDVIVVVVLLLVVVAEVSRAVEEVKEGTDNGAFTLTGKRVVVAAVGERRLRSRVTTATTAFSVVARTAAAAAVAAPPHRGMQSGSNTRLLRPERFRVVDGYCKVTPLPCFNAGLLVVVVVVAVVEATTSCGAEDSSSRTRAIANGQAVQGESAGRRSIFKSSSRSVVFPHCCFNRSMDRSRITDQ